MTPEELNIELKNAINEENIESINNLLKQGAHLFVGDNTLQEAVNKDNIEFLKNLQSTKIKDAYSTGLMHYAAEKGKNDLVKELIKSDFEDFKKYKNERRENLLFPKQAKEIAESIEKNKTQTQERQEISLNSLKKRHLEEIEKDDKYMTELYETKDAWYNQKNVYSNTPLHIAAIHGHKLVARTLLNAGAQADIRGSNDYTPIDLAVINNNPEVVKELVQRGITSNIGDDYYKILESINKIDSNELNRELKEAINEENIIGVKWLLNKKASLFFGDITLQEAVNKDNIEFLKNLQSTKIEDARSYSLIHYAAEQGKNNLVKELIKADFEDFKKNMNARRENLLFPRQAKEIAESIEKNKTQTQERQEISLKSLKKRHLEEIERDDRSMTELYETKDAWYNQKTVHSNTALHIAAISGQVEVLKTLLDGGAKPDVKNGQNDTPLHLAVINNHLDSVKELVQRGTTRSMKADDTKIKDIINNLKNQIDRKEVLESFLNVQYKDGMTILHHSIINHNYELTKLFFDLGGDSKIKDDKGRNASDYAIDNNINYAGYSGTTLLHYVIEKNSPNTIHFLFDLKDEYGMQFIDLKPIDKNGQTPLDIALENIKSPAAIVFIEKLQELQLDAEISTMLEDVVSLHKQTEQINNLEEDLQQSRATDLNKINDKLTLNIAELSKVKSKEKIYNAIDDRFVYNNLLHKIGHDHRNYEKAKELYPAYRAREILRAADVLINDGCQTEDHIIDLSKIEQALKDKNFTNIIKPEKRTIENIANVNEIMQGLDKTHPETYDEYLIKFANHRTFSEVIGKRLEDLQFKDIKLHNSVDDNAIKEVKHEIKKANLTDFLTREAFAKESTKFSNNLKKHKTQNMGVSKER